MASIGYVQVQFVDDAESVGSSHTVAAAQSAQAGGPCVIDASRSSAVYGKSDTVQPHSITCFIWRRTA